MITLEIDEKIYKYTVLSEKEDIQDIEVQCIPDEGIMNIIQYETEDDEDDDFQLITLTPQLAYALYGILKTTLEEAKSDEKANP